MELPPAALAAFGGGKQTNQVCVTQEQIDRYGTVPPQTRRGCRIENVRKRANGMSADMVCSGEMQGKGNLEASWSAGGKTEGKLHFIGGMGSGPDDATPVEWTIEYVSVYKGPDCGSVKPVTTR